MSDFYEERFKEGPQNVAVALPNEHGKLVFSGWRTPDDSKVHKGGLRKIADLPKVCLSPEHNPPTHYCYQDGVYEYTCPGCGKTQVFTIRNPTM